MMAAISLLRILLLPVIEKLGYAFERLRLLVFLSDIVLIEFVL